MMNLSFCIIGVMFFREIQEIVEKFFKEVKERDFG